MEVVPREATEPLLFSQYPRWHEMTSTYKHILLEWHLDGEHGTWWTSLSDCGDFITSITVQLVDNECEPLYPATVRDDRGAASLDTVEYEIVGLQDSATQPGLGGETSSSHHSASGMFDDRPSRIPLHRTALNEWEATDFVIASSIPFFSSSKHHKANDVRLIRKSSPSLCDLQEVAIVKTHRMTRAARTAFAHLNHFL